MAGGGEEASKSPSATGCKQLFLTIITEAHELQLQLQLYNYMQLGTRLTGGREEISTPSILAFCFSADLQWSEHPSPFWTFHAAVPLVKAASSRNYMGKYMFFSGFAKHPNYLFQWMKPLLKVMMFLHQIDKV